MTLVHFTVALSALPRPSDEEAIRTVEHRWLDAEYHADTAALKQLLVPEYPTLRIEFHGATALATFTVPDTSYTVDVFVYETGAGVPCTPNTPWSSTNRHRDAVTVAPAAPATTHAARLDRRSTSACRQPGCVGISSHRRPQARCGSGAIF